MKPKQIKRIKEFLEKDTTDLPVTMSKTLSGSHINFYTFKKSDPKEFEKEKKQLKKAGIRVIDMGKHIYFQLDRNFRGQK